MTKDEIKTLISEKISGQGNQVDIGGALADVLNAIVDAVSNPGYRIELPAIEGGALVEITEAEFKNAEIAIYGYEDGAIRLNANIVEIPDADGNTLYNLIYNTLDIDLPGEFDDLVAYTTTGGAFDNEGVWDLHQVDYYAYIKCTVDGAKKYFVYYHEV